MISSGFALIQIFGTDRLDGETVVILRGCFPLKVDVSTHKLYFVASPSFSSLFARGLSNLFVELWLKISNCQICNIMRYLDYHKYQQNYSSFLFTNYIYLMKILACIKQQNHVFLFFFRIKFYDLEQVKYSFRFNRKKKHAVCTSSTI